MKNCNNCKNANFYLGTGGVSGCSKNIWQRGDNSHPHVVEIIVSVKECKHFSAIFKKEDSKDLGDAINHKCHPLNPEYCHVDARINTSD